MSFILGQNYNFPLTDPSGFVTPKWQQRLSQALVLNANGPNDIQQWNGILNAQQFPGSDIGAQINAAYAALPATGGTIMVSVGNYDFSIPIVFGVFGKPVLLVGSPGGAVTLNFTLDSGAAITCDWGAGHLEGPGIRDIALTGSAGTSIGLSLGDTNSLDEAYFLGLSISGFATNARSINSSFKHNFVSCEFHDATTGFLFSVGSEAPVFEGCIFFENATGLSITANTVDAYLYGCSFDQNTVVGISLTNGSAVHLFGCHFENPGGGTSQFITATSGRISIFGGQILDDLASGTQPQFISFSGDTLEVYGMEIFATGGRTITQAVTLGGSANARLFFVNLSPTTIAHEYNTAYTNGRVVNWPTRSDTAIVNWNTVNYKQITDVPWQCATVPIYANNAAAITGGLVAGDLYRTNVDPDFLAIVH